MDGLQSSVLCVLLTSRQGLCIGPEEMRVYKFNRQIMRLELGPDMGHEKVLHAVTYCYNTTFWFFTPGYVK